MKGTRQQVVKHSMCACVRVCVHGCIERMRRRQADSSEDCSSTSNTCHLLVVADDLLYKRIGMNSISNTVHVLVSHLYN